MGSTGRAAAPPCQPAGAQQGLVIAVNFPSNPIESKPISQIADDYFAASNSLAAYWSEVSYGQTTLTGTAVGWFTLDYPGWEACDIYDIRLAALAEAAQSVDITQYNRIFLRIQLHAGCDLGAAGIGDACSVIPLPGGGTQEVSTSWNFADALDVIIHEGGHNLGLPHANSEDHGAAIVGAVGDTGTSTEYGDLFDVMGQSTRLGHFSAVYKERLGLVTTANVVNVVATGTHLIEPLTTTGTGTKALKIFRGAFWDSASIPRQVRKEYLWVETRKDTGFDANLYKSGETPQSAYGGAIVHMDRELGNRSHILDLHPASISNDFLDAPLESGERFTDPFTGIVIEHNGTKKSTGNMTIAVTIPNPDSDQDGLTDATESSYGTNPALEDSDGDTLSDFYEVCYDNNCNQYNPGVTDTDANLSDTDGDGMPDDWEIHHNLNPLAANGNADIEPDGLTNVQEFAAGTDPNRADTDGDRLTDGDEINVYFTDPLDGTDTDEDGMRDDWENVRGTNPLINDAAVDSDGDTVPNVIEYLRDTLPLDAASTPTIQTIYVDAAAPAGGDGSAQNPYNGLPEALSAAQHGDTLELAPGTYAPYWISNQKSINIFGPTDRSAVISTGLFVHTFALWGRFGGLTFTLSGSNFFDNLRNFTLENCQLDAAKGIIVNSTHMTIRNGVLNGPNNGTGTGISVQNDSNIQIINATVAEYNVGLAVTSGIPVTVVRNSIFSNVDDLSGFADTSGFLFNLIANGELAGTAGNFMATPQFVGGNDFHLLLTSPGIDAGDPLDDFGNEPENNGDRINAGAYGDTAEATAGPDTDGDGLTDQNEQCFDGDCGAYDPYDPATNPTGTDLDITNTDTDGDGFTDDVEVAAGSNPIDPGSLPPPDGDVNMDSVVNAADVILMRRHVLGIITLTPMQVGRGDLYPAGAGDGALTLSDLILLIQNVLVP